MSGDLERRAERERLWAEIQYQEAAEQIAFVTRKPGIAHGHLLTVNRLRARLAALEEPAGLFDATGEP